MHKVLVVEDDKYISGAYQAILEKAGYEFKLASDGIEALKVLESWLPNIIVLDLVMPRKDGFATLEEIKANDKLRRISVLVLTNLGQSKDYDRAMRLGASAYVIKSATDPADLVAHIRKILG